MKKAVLVSLLKGMVVLAAGVAVVCLIWPDEESPAQARFHWVMEQIPRLNWYAICEAQNLAADLSDEQLLELEEVVAKTQNSGRNALVFEPAVPDFTKGRRSKILSVLFPWREEPKGRIYCVPSMRTVGGDWFRDLRATLARLRKER